MRKTILHKMRGATIAIALMTAAISAFAQPNYKYILQHMGEWTDREALYKLEDYRQWHPREAHPYYLMANIYYRLQADEHPIVDYDAKMRCLYNARVFYGNCKAFLPSDDVKSDWYAETAIGGKVTDGSVKAYLDEHLKDVALIEQRTTALYEAYHRLVTDYDSCGILFTAFSMRYNRLKEAQMLYDEEDAATLGRLKVLGDRIQPDIDSLQGALNGCPVEGYQPQFRYRRIDLYRIDGLVGSDMLRQEVTLWDYSEWVDRFEQGRKEVLQLRDEMDREHRRLIGQIENAIGREWKEDTRLMNNIEKLDEGSPMRELLHLEWQEGAMASLMTQIKRDTVTADEWIVCLQLANRMNQLYKTLQKTVVRLPRQLQIVNDNKTGRCQPYYKYKNYIDKWYGEQGQPATASWGSKACSGLKQVADRMWKEVEDWLQEAQTRYALPKEVQIGEDLVAEVDDEQKTVRFRKGKVYSITD